MARRQALRLLEATSLSDVDIKGLLPGIRIVAYPALTRVRSLYDVCDAFGRLVIFFETTATNVGHWTCLWLMNGHWQYFDSYGYAPDDDRYFVATGELRILRETSAPLSRLMGPDAGNYSSIDFQSKHPGIDTCGRHVVVRLWNRELSDRTYAMRLLPDADEKVTIVTENELKKIQ